MVSMCRCPPCRLYQMLIYAKKVLHSECSELFVPFSASQRLACVGETGRFPAATLKLTRRAWSKARAAATRRSKTVLVPRTVTKTGHQTSAGRLYCTLVQLSG